MQEAAMKDQTLGVIALGVVAVGAAWTVHTLTSTDYYCPGPSASSVVALLAPCQAFNTALGHTVSSDQAVRMALPWGSDPDRADPPPTQFAEK
jgi:hypothetical protein